VPPYRSTATNQLAITASKVKSPCHIPTVSSWLTDQQSLISTRRASHWLSPDQPPPSTPPISPDHSLQEHHQTRTITASECISQFPRSRPPQVHLHICSITAAKCISEFTQSRPPSASPNSLHHGLQMPLQTPSISASKCISEFTRSWHPSTSPNSLDHGLGVYLWAHSIVIFRRTLNSSQAPPAASLDILCVDG